MQERERVGGVKWGRERRRERERGSGKEKERTVEKENGKKSVG